jgi:hypothetical protein
MTTTTDILEEQALELDERENDGIRVTLVWNRGTGELKVLVSDERTLESFVIDVTEADNAYDVFNHPFAYAAFRGLRETSPVELPELEPVDRAASMV